MRIKALLLAMSLMGLSVLTSQAQITKIGSIDLRKVFDGYWKTKQADVNLKEEAAGLDKESKAMVAQFQKAQEEYKKVMDAANDPAITADEREKRKKTSEEELLKLKQLQRDAEQFDRQARATLGEKQRRMRDNILNEIKEVIRSKAKSGGYSYIIDTASETVNNTPVVLYTSNDNDISDAVLAQLNLTAPQGVLKPGGDAKPDETKPAPKDDKK